MFVSCSRFRGGIHNIISPDQKHSIKCYRELRTSICCRCSPSLDLYSMVLTLAYLVVPKRMILPTLRRGRGTFFANQNYHGRVGVGCTTVGNDTVKATIVEYCGPHLNGMPDAFFVLAYSSDVLWWCSCCTNVSVDRISVVRISVEGTFPRGLHLSWSSFVAASARARISKIPIKKGRAAGALNSLRGKRSRNATDGDGMNP